MIVKLDKKVVGKPIFDMQYLRGEILNLYHDKDMLYLDSEDLGYIVKLNIKPSSIRLKTSLGHTVDYEEV